MRKETSNQFTEGMVCDMNPINTPNTVLTDNLNGTIITYNGNEFSLQNDRGNYELKYCRLKPNYIPVGIKEYGDILYIVSYNPLDKNVEIGSYPSPLMISTPDENNSPDNEIRSIIKSQIIDKNLSEEKYTILTENADSIIFNGENFKLNPGDEYCIQIQENNPVYKYETVEYNILDEESNIHKITDLIQIDEDGGDEDFSHIKWTIPGWLMINARLAELSVAGINIRYFYLSNKTINFSFNLRLNIQDEFLIRQGTLNQWCENITSKDKLNDIKFRIRIFSKDKVYIEKDCSINDTTTEEGLTLAESGWTEWYKDSRIIWQNIVGSIEVDNVEDEITVEMIPILSETLEGGTYQIVYDNLTQSLIFDLKSVDDTDWNIGTELYQFTTSNDAVKIYTNVVGPKITGAIVNLEYEIYNLKEEKVASGVFSDYFGIGENVLYINYDDKFRKENIYIIRYKFTSGNKVYNTVDRFLITSELLNEFTDRALFDRDINFDEWVLKYWSRVPDIELSENDFSLNTTEEFSWESPMTERDKIYFAGNQYNTFHPYPDSGLSDEIKLKKGYKYNYTLDKELKPNALTGDLWSALDPDIKLQYKDNKTEEMVDLDKTVNVYKYLEKDLKYSEYGTPFEFGNMSVKTFNNESEYSCDLYINLYGKGADDRDFECSGRFKRGDVLLDDEIGRIVVDNKNGDTGYYNVSGHIESFLTKYGLSFIKVNVHFKERNNTYNWNLSNRYLSEVTWLGKWDIDLAVSMGNYIFNGLDNTSRTLTFIAFKTRNKFTINEGKPYEGAVTLLPITNNKYSDELYLNFIKSLFYITEDTKLVSYIRYELKGDSWNNIPSLLELYQAGVFSKNEYFGINLLNPETKKQYISKWDVKYFDIFVNGKNFDSKPQKVVTIPFDINLDENIYPYKNSEDIGIYDLDIKLRKLTLSIESDYSVWTKLFEQVSKRKNTKGVYCHYASDSDSIINNLTTNYRESGIISLSPWVITELSAIGINELAICWVAGRTSDRDIKNDILGDNGKIVYGSVFKQNDLILEDKWPWLRDEI